jgi:hypothetical protein
MIIVEGNRSRMAEILAFPLIVFLIIIKTEGVILLSSATTHEYNMMAIILAMKQY